MPIEIENYNILDLVSDMEFDLRRNHLAVHYNKQQDWNELVEELIETLLPVEVTENTRIMKAYVRDYTYDELRAIYDENPLCSDMVGKLHCPFNEYLEYEREDVSEGENVEIILENRTYYMFLATLCIKKLKAIDI
jgi:hypothetical protein